MKSASCIVFFIAILTATVVSQSIVDFTYSQYDRTGGKESRSSGVINIKPDRQIIQGYTFPQACYLARKLEQEKIQDSQDLANYDMDSMIDGLKIDFIELLKVSEKIKKKKGNIEQLSEMSGRSTNVTIVAPKDLDTLRSQQDKLSKLNNEIKIYTQQLQDLVRDSMRNSDNNEFAISALNFQIESLRLKLDYLKNLRKNSNDVDVAKSKDQYDKYFYDLKRKFDEQNDLVDDLNTILKNFNEIGQLRAKISNLKSKIDIANLMIEQKQACAKEKDEIKKFQRNDHQIKSLMSNLRQKKKDKSNINNKYCQGVAKKLQDRVKKVLLSYDYTFECAQGLEEMKSGRDRDLQQLRRLQRRLKQIEDSAGIEDYKRKFDLNRQYIKNKQDQLSSFSIPAYYHDIHELDRLIAKTELQLSEAINKKRELGNPSNSKPVDYKQIQNYVNKIKKLKGTYCEEYEKYDNKAQTLWKQVQRHEAEIQYSSKIRGIYEEEINQLRDLEANFDRLRSKILERIQ